MIKAVVFNYFSNHLVVLSVINIIATVKVENVSD
jgi:hypothetical protein